MFSRVFIITIAIICISFSKFNSFENELKHISLKKEQIEEDVTNLTPWEKYIKAEKYLYIWEYYTPEYILKLCQEHNFSRVYLSIGCIETFWDDYYSQGIFPASGEIGSWDYETFIKKLNDINVEVELRYSNILGRQIKICIKLA